MAQRVTNANLASMYGRYVFDEVGAPAFPLHYVSQVKIDDQGLIVASLITRLLGCR